MNSCGHVPTVGIIANPAAGKDIRRLVSSASPTSDMAKIGIIRRAVVGAVRGGAGRVVLTDDRRSLAARAIERIGVDAEFVLLPVPPFDVSRNSVVAAMEMRDHGAGAVVVLGGDGTNRDVVKGWRDVPMLSLSTGTNNVFPRHWEATIAGEAAAAVASGAAPIDDVSWTAKIIEVTVHRNDASSDDPSNADESRADPSRADESVETDLALVDLAVIDGAFTASRAVWAGDRLRELVTTVAEPASVGLSSIAARLAPTGRREPTGVHVTFAGCDRSPVSAPDPTPLKQRTGPSRTVSAPLAPGRYVDVEVARWRRLDPGDPVELNGPGVLSFDGERDLVLRPGQAATARLSADGPRVIDVDAALARAVQAN